MPHRNAIRGLVAVASNHSGPGVRQLGLSAAGAEGPTDGFPVPGHGVEPKITTKTRALRRPFTVVMKSFSSGPSSNQMEDANSKRDDGSTWAVNVLYNQIEDE